MRRRLGNLSRTVFLVAAMALGAGQVPGSTLDPELEDILRSAAPDDEVAVLVTLAGRLDPSALSFPSKAARRRGIAVALRAEAIKAEAPVQRFLRDRGALRVRSLWAVGGLAATVRADTVQGLADLSGVANVRLDRVFESPGDRPKTTAEGGWNLEMVGATDLWARGMFGDGVVVAVVDTGVDAAHQDLTTRWRGGANSWFDPYFEHLEPHDTDGHGTQVAGLIVGGDAGGIGIGVAPDARWIAGKVFDDGGQATFSATHEIFQWLLDPDGDPATDDAPHIVNNSWGFRDLPGECVEEFADDIQVLRAAGIAVVFSAGNTGPNEATSLSPANNPGALAVGGTDDRDEVMATSGRGPSACGGGVYPMLVAPGDRVRTADLTFGGIFPGAYTEVSGTSFASPQVAGAMALLLGAHPQATLEQTEQALRVGAEDLGPDGPDDASGYGRLDVVTAESMLAALVGGAANPVVYADEHAYLAALAGQATITEGFENDVTWGDARAPATAASVSSQDVTWTSNHPGNDVTTGYGAAHTGVWGIYSLPHGDQTVTQPFDFVKDGFSGSSLTPMNAVGGWFVSTSGGQISVILDGDDANPIDLGPVGVFHDFLGVVVDGSFTSFEFRETEGTVEDPKLVFADDLTIGVAGGGANRPPQGAILQPAADVTVAVGEAVFFEGTASDPDGDAVTVVWNLGDGSTSTQRVPGNHVYTATGSFVVTLTATDDQGLADPTPDSRLITVSNPPPAAPDGVVAGVANLPGAQGSDWHSDLFLHNASTSVLSLQLFFSPAGGTPGPPVDLSIEPDRTLALHDVVNTEFGVTGSGAIGWSVVSGEADGLFVSANTFNRVDASRRYGQQIPGVRWAETAPAGTSVWVPALAGRYRTNLGFATDGDCTQVTIRGFDRSGLQVAQRVLSVQPLSWVQLNGIFRSVFPGLIDDPDTVAPADSIHRFEVIGSNGRVAAYTSVIDNVTSDGSYMQGQQAVDALQFSWLPGAARISGANNSRWRSDVILMHVGGSTDSTDFSFLGPGANSSGSVDTRAVTLDPDESVVEEDILGNLFGYPPPAVGSLSMVYPQASGAMVWMRTYTEESLANGDLQTYGQAIGPRRQDAMVTATTEGRIPGFSHDQATRSNLILQNTRAAGGEYLGSTVRVQVLAPDGQVLHQQLYMLEPGEYLQHNRFLDDYEIPHMNAGTVRVTVSDQVRPGETGGVDAMISEVNGNVIDGTNDGRLIRAQGSGPL